MPGPSVESQAARDLRAALADDSPSPRLLICPPGMPLWALLAGSVSHVPAPGRLVALVLADLPPEAWRGLLAEARRTATRLCVDLTQQKPAVVERVVDTLAAALDHADGVLVAVDINHFRQYIQLWPARVVAFNPLYLQPG